MKTKIFVLGLVCLFFFSCSSKFNDAQASSVIRSSFELSDEDALEIMGISMESNELALVKFKLNDVQLSSKIRKYDKGWQLDEIQNDFGMWVPAGNLTGMFSHSEKQKIAMTEIATIATILMDYTVDHGRSPEHTGPYNETSSLYKDLCPTYAESLPIKDPWGNNYLVYSGSSSEGMHGMVFAAGTTDEFIVMSLGRDGEVDSWSFDEAGASFYEITSTADYDNDLVCWNGQFVRSPRTK